MKFSNRENIDLKFQTIAKNVVKMLAYMMGKIKEHNR